eukprot:GGOE01025082.1.p2 GENE.GGOE01025082.1~~GGOE01025082.1.p2  ORF type:complete len:455 (-),score=101.51 GGOE01025082.1:284-1648(-)
MLPAGPSAWSKPGSDSFWNEQNTQLRAMLLKRDEELRQLQNTLLKQNTELFALKQQEQKDSSRDQSEGQLSSRACDVSHMPMCTPQVESNSEATQADLSMGEGQADPNRQQLLQQLANLQTHTQMIQEEVNQLRAMVHLRRSPSKLAAKAQRSFFKDAAAALDAHSSNASSPTAGVGSTAPHSSLWLEFLQWMRAHGIQDMDQLRVFIVTHAGKRFLRDLANDICDADDLLPETPDGINTPDRRYSLLSSVTDIPISDPRPLMEAEHPPALSWDMAEYEVINSTTKRASFTLPLHGDQRSPEQPPHSSPVVPPLPVHMLQQPNRRRSPTKAKSPRKKALSARTYKSGDLHRPRSFTKHLEVEGGGSARNTPRGRTWAAPISPREGMWAHLSVNVGPVGYQRRSASTVANATNFRGNLADRAPQSSPRKSSKTSQTSILTPRPQAVVNRTAGGKP